MSYYFLTSCRYVLTLKADPASALQSLWRVPLVSGVDSSIAFSPSGQLLVNDETGAWLVDSRQAVHKLPLAAHQAGPLRFAQSSERWGTSSSKFLWGKEVAQAALGCEDTAKGQPLPVTGGLLL